MLRLFFIACLCACHFAYATRPPRIEYIGIERGLSNNALTCIYEDHDGFMWFGTYDGLNRYDGYNFKVFRNIIGDSNSLPDNHLYSISGDQNHRLWIGASKGLSVYDPFTARFLIPRFLKWDGSKKIQLSEGVTIVRSVDNQRIILAGTPNNGLLVFENGTEGIQVPLRDLPGNQGNYSVSSIEYDSGRKLAWIAVPGMGIYQYNIATRALKLFDANFRFGGNLKLSKSGVLWIGNNSGLFPINIELNKAGPSAMLPNSRITSLMEDREGILWITSDGGGLWYLPKGASKAVAYLSAEGKELINSNAVYAIYEDRLSRKWIGTLRGGINIIHPVKHSLNHISYNVAGKNNVIDNFILSFCEDEKENIWIGTDGAGLRYWDRKQNTYTIYNQQSGGQKATSSNFITNILRDSKNNIWISTWHGGINRFVKETNSFKKYQCINPTTNTAENNVWLVYEDNRKNIWASTVNNGSLYTFNNVSEQFELFDNSIRNIQCLAEDRDNNLWAGNYTSLLKIDRDKKTSITYPIGYPVRAIHEDRNHNLWVGTEGGGLLLFNRTDGTYQRYTTAEELPSNSILRILEDDKNNLWISTYNGLCRFNLAQRTCRNFSHTDGLQSNQFSFNAALRLSSGEMMFGGIKGFNIFYPDSLEVINNIPKLFLNNLSIDNVSTEKDDSYVTKRLLEKPVLISVPFEKAILSLEFLALEYSSADKIKYAYLLQGWDKNWIYTNQIRTANYSRLAEGEYIFKVKATDSNGEWGNETELLRIVILPPWYRTWWAYISYILAFAGAVYLYVLYNKRQERMRYEIKLARLEKEKEKELTERKINFFTHISHELRTPLTLIINPLKEIFKKAGNDESGKTVSMIYRNAKRMLSLVDQLLLFRKVESVDQQMRIERFDIGEVCREVYLSFGHHALAKHMHFEFRNVDHNLSFYGDKEKIEIILFNLVSNAFKYTQERGSVSLEIADDVRSIDIIVRDNGTGIPAEVGDKLFDSFYRADSKQFASQTGFGIGLYVSYRLARAHHGKLSYNSEPGKGSEFRLSLLKGKEHFGSQYISDDYKAGPSILEELVEEPLTELIPEPIKPQLKVIDKLVSELPVMVIVDDNAELRSYIRDIFSNSFNIYDADDGEEGYELVVKQVPDILISDVMMKKVGGIELCQKIKANPNIAHIPVLLLTASSSDEIKLQGIMGGADDYITKPFDKDLIIARIQNILKGRSRLQQYFFNAVTLKPTTSIPGEHKEFIEACMAIVDKHIHDPEFNVKTFCREIGMSHPALYKKIKIVSGLTINVFVRYLRLRKAAELLINTDKSIVEVTYITGFNDIKYFREQFNKLFEMNPSEYIKRYRRVLKNQGPADQS